jgi:hypothetical protein
MIASQFNLDHRLAELRQVNDGRLVAEALRAGQPASNPAASLLGAIRSLLGGQPAGRPTRIAAH